MAFASEVPASTALAPVSANPLMLGWAVMVGWRRLDSISSRKAATLLPLAGRVEVPLALLVKLPTWVKLPAIVKSSRSMTLSASTAPVMAAQSVPVYR